MSRLKELFDAGEFVVTGEVAPPRGTDLSGMHASVDLLAPYCHALNVTDNQGATLHLSSLAASRAILDRGIEPIFQQTCRDRNRLALQSDLLAAWSLGLENVLMVTGDDPRAGDHPHAKGVFDLDSTQLAGIARAMNEGRDMTGRELKGATKHAGEIKGKNVAVFGAGPIGLMGVMCLKSFGAKRIVAIDIVEKRLKMAIQCGATDAINSNDDVLGITRKMTDGVGLDVVFDAAGVPATVNTGIEIARNGGTLLLVGMASPKMEIEYKHAVVKELRLQSSYMYTSEMREGLQMIIDGKLDVAQMITSRYPMSKGPRIFEELASGKTSDIKVILTNE